MKKIQEQNKSLETKMINIKEETKQVINLKKKNTLFINELYDVYSIKTHVSLTFFISTNFNLNVSTKFKI